MSAAVSLAVNYHDFCNSARDWDDGRRDDNTARTLWISARGLRMAQSAIGEVMMDLSVLDSYERQAWAQLELHWLPSLTGEIA